jgi:hypothetical protein
VVLPTGAKSKRSATIKNGHRTSDSGAAVRRYDVLDKYGALKVPMVRDMKNRDVGRSREGLKAEFELAWAIPGRSCV